MKGRNTTYPTTPSSTTQDTPHLEHLPPLWSTDTDVIPGDTWNVSTSPLAKPTCIKRQFCSMEVKLKVTIWEVRGEAWGWCANWTYNLSVFRLELRYKSSTPTCFFMKTFLFYIDVTSLPPLLLWDVLMWTLNLMYRWFSETHNTRCFFLSYSAGCLWTTRVMVSLLVFAQLDVFVLPDQSN